MKASAHFHRLNFNVPSGTSRGVLKYKDTWYIKLEDDNGIGWGECSVIKGLSPDIINGIHEKIEDLINQFNLEGTLSKSVSTEFPALKFAFEMARLDLERGGTKDYFDDTSQLENSGIPINGLIWMGDIEYMKKQLREKVDLGFSCLKMKIAALDFQAELDILKWIRKEFPSDNLTLRVDANGGFSPSIALENLKRLSQYDIHSIEQPIKPRQFEDLHRLCEESPIPIALDEELIGVSKENILPLLNAVKPQYIILKPSLLGGFRRSDEWIDAAKKRSIGWWITSALESNLGLYTIAEWTATKNVTMPQGLGTGSLFSNNIQAPLEIVNAHLVKTDAKWDELTIHYAS